MSETDEATLLLSFDRFINACFFMTCARFLREFSHGVEFWQFNVLKIWKSPVRMPWSMIVDIECSSHQFTFLNMRNVCVGHVSRPRLDFIIMNHRGNAESQMPCIGGRILVVYIILYCM